ncbi:MAG: septum formation initiator family protein, partial [Coprobacillus sp.]
YTLSMSVYRVVIQRNQLATLTSQLEELENEKKSLSKEVELLNDDDYVTRYARDNYVFPRDGEEVVKLPDVDNAKK